MPAQTTLVTDSMTRADNADLGATWDVQTGHLSLKIVSNAAVPFSVGSDCAENYNGITWPNDQWAEAEFTTSGGVSATRGPGIGLRMSSSAQTWYRTMVNENASANIIIRKFVAGVSTAITTFTATYAAGGKFKVAIVGTTLYIYYQDVLLGTVIDSAIAAGRGGLDFSSSTTTSSMKNFAGGAAYIMPPPPTVVRTAVSRAANW